MYMYALLVATALAPAQVGGARQSQRVACIGDSITFGAGVADREHNAYPAQLAALLGDAYEVRNFGVGGQTLLRAADTPYIDTGAYGDVLAWRPDVAVVLLGTNDTCWNERRGNWAHAQGLEGDALGLTRALRLERPEVRVILCAPTPMFPDAPELDEARRADLRARAPRLDRIGVVLRSVARTEMGVEFLDLSDVIGVEQVVDGVHTNPFGARSIARRVAEAVESPEAGRLGLPRALRAHGHDVTRSDFHGFRRLQFRLDQAEGNTAGPECMLVIPESAARGYPWVLRARFFGHEPALDRALLARGYHLAYCDVAGLYGADAALARWDAFHSLCVDLGLSPRVTLEGMSRGGLVVLNWASRRPEAVEAIYVDNPVCDFRSWPGGASGKRSDSDWEGVKAAYRLSEDEALAYDRMPLDRLEPIAAANIPLFVVMGTADDVVPVRENGEVLIRRFEELGGSVQVWRKPGLGHHPHGLHPVDPLLRGLLQATGRGRNPAVRAVPSAEYRGQSAGWGGGTWWGQLDALRTLGAQHQSARVVFLGDSITQGLTGSQSRSASEGGTRAIDRFHGTRGALGLGLSGDRTEHLLYRIQYGALAEVDPDLVVLAIGVNNVNAAKHTGAETAAGLEAVVESLLKHEQQAHILVCGPFPAGSDPKDARRVALDVVHRTAERLGALERVTYIDLRPLFLDENGRPNELMSGDHIHITAAGREAWLEAIEPTVKRLLVH